ncbi:MAG: hypothetical protein ACE5OQ_13770 [Woeseia sp.]
MTANTDRCLMVNKLIISLILIAFTTACVTMRPLSTTDSQSLASQIEVGDKIKIVRNDDTDVAFKVSAVSDEGLSGDGVFVAYSDIRRVQVGQSTSATTLGVVAGIGILVALIASGGGGSGGGGPGGPGY